MSTWCVIPSDQFQRDMKKMTKQYPRETAQMRKNLQRYLQMLEESDNPLLLVTSSFVHRESSGCHAITQQSLAAAAQTRLYVYAYVTDLELHLICAGDKQSQPKDNQFCKEFITHL